MRFLLLLSLLALVGCSRTPTGLSAELPGTAWTLERVVHDDGRVDRGSGERITFKPDGSVLITSCNTCNGTYRMRGNELRVNETLACTRRGCGPNEVELETFFDGPMSLQRDGSYLIVEGGASSGVQLLFLPVSEGGAVSSTPADS